MIDTPIWYPKIRIKKFEANTNGKNTIIVVSVAANIERHTSFVPSTAASSEFFSLRK